MDNGQFTVYMISQWFMVVATLSLGIIAIWGDWIKAKFFSARLTVEILKPQGEAAQFNDGVQSRHYHLVIKNQRRHSLAHNVRVLITGLARPTADGRYGSSPLAGVIQLVWQYKDSVPQFPVIGPPLICDLGNIPQGKSFSLATMYCPCNLDTTINKDQKAKVTVQAVCDEGESCPLDIEIAWDGKWEADAARMAEHLVIKVL